MTQCARSEDRHDGAVGYTGLLPTRGTEVLSGSEAETVAGCHRIRFRPSGKIVVSWSTAVEYGCVAFEFARCSCHAHVVINKLLEPLHSHLQSTHPPTPSINQPIGHPTTHPLRACSPDLRLAMLTHCHCTWHSSSLHHVIASHPPHVLHVLSVEASLDAAIFQFGLLFPPFSPHLSQVVLLPVLSGCQWLLDQLEHRWAASTGCAVSLQYRLHRAAELWEIRRCESGRLCVHIFVHAKSLDVWMCECVRREGIGTGGWHMGPSGMSQCGIMYAVLSGVRTCIVCAGWWWSYQA